MTDIPEYNNDNTLALESAKKLVSCMEKGNVSQANELILELGKLRENSLFFQIGKMTRELHNALINFHSDTGLSSLADNELADARARLNYVIEKTDEAANRTMDNIEKTIPLSNNLAKQANALFEEWGKFRRKELTVDEFKDLYEDMMEFLQNTGTSATDIHQNLTDVVVAQDFQDLTGQVIRKVITLVTNLEDALVNLVRISSEADYLEQVHPELRKNSKGKEVDPVAADGPHVDGTKSSSSSEIVRNQDDVDELLSSLGF